MTIILMASRLRPERVTSLSWQSHSVRDTALLRRFAVVVRWGLLSRAMVQIIETAPHPICSGRRLLCGHPCLFFCLLPGDNRESWCRVYSAIVLLTSELWLFIFCSFLQRLDVGTRNANVASYILFVRGYGHVLPRVVIQGPVEHEWWRGML